MRPLEPQPLEYRTVTPLAPTPQLWIACVLVFIQFIGVICGRMIWPAFWPGKDPEVEFAWANGGGFVFFAILCFFFGKRLSRFRIVDALLILLIGVLSSAVGIAWGIHDGYGR